MNPNGNPGPFSGLHGGFQGSSLGINAKSRPTLDFERENYDSETGEIAGPKYDPVSGRLERFALQSVVRSILPKSRTAKCLRLRQGKGGRLIWEAGDLEGIPVYRSLAHGSTSYGGLQTCASVWSCPLCSAKISERRRVELKAAMATWEAQGGSVVLLTLTHGHTQADRLADLVAGQQKAVHRLFACRQGVELMSALGRVGHVRAWEVTHGRKRQINNGWHPHFHILLFLDTPCLDLSIAESWVFQVWHNACRLADLPLPSRAYGVKLDDGIKAAEYVAKLGLEDARENLWGMDHEMTKGHTKRAKDGETPFDFLRSCLLGNDPVGRRLFLEYAQAFHGKRQLVWSRGLRERLGVDLVTDEDLAGSHEDDAEILGRLSDQDWRLVLRFDVRGELLELARHGWEPVQRFLQSLESMGVKS
jgi:hypothetical protein